MARDKFGYGKRKFEKGVQKGCKKCGKLQVVKRGRKTCPRCKGKLFP